MIYSIKKSTYLIVASLIAGSLTAADPVAVRYFIDPIKMSTQEIMGEVNSCFESQSHRTPQRIIGASLTIQDHFLGAQKQESAQINTDTSGCVGTQQFLVCIKGRVRTFNKNTGAADHVLNVSLDRFFRVITGGEFLSDPRPLFDPHSKRWFIVALTEAPTETPPINNLQRSLDRLMLAVSDSDIITSDTIWSFYIIDDGLGRPTESIFDFPTLGIDEDAVYLGANISLAPASIIPGPSANSAVWVIQKSSLLSGGSAAVSAFYDLSTGFNMLTPQPASNFDTGGDVGYIISYDRTSSLRVLLSQVLNPGSLTPQLTAPVLVPAPRNGGAFNPPALGSSNPIGALNDRMTSAPHIRNNQLWAVYDVGMDSTGQRPASGQNRVGGIYIRIDVTNPAGPFVVAQSGSLFDPALTNPRSYFFNSIMTNKDGKVLIGSTTCGTNERLNAAVSLLLTSSSSFSTVLYTNSTTNFNPTDDTRSSNIWRWGDYSLVSLDPVDQKTFWAIEMYTSDTNTWGVEVAKISVP